MSKEEERCEVRLGSRLAFTTTMARALVELMPRLGHVKGVRQWAGPYDLSPDGHPIVRELPGGPYSPAPAAPPLSGDLPGPPVFHVVCAFRGRGFMRAPVVARHFAAHLRGG